MSESIQKKLLRVRPPRVKITYDVETGGAMEKKELPFIVGIFSDLKGDREDPANYESLKTRLMLDIDRDNFNDVMNTLKPRVDLEALVNKNDILKQLSDEAANTATALAATKAAQDAVTTANTAATDAKTAVDSALTALTAAQTAADQDKTDLAKAKAVVDATDDLEAKQKAAKSANAVLATANTELDKLVKHQLIFDKIDAFEPMSVVRAFPGLNEVYSARSGIRSLQTKAESNDAISAALDTLMDTVNLGTNAVPALSVANTTVCSDALAALLSIKADESAAMLAPFVTQFNIYYIDSNPSAADIITQARIRGSVAIMDVLVTLIDQKLSVALSTIMHCEGFKKMEATWRGLFFLVMNTETSTMLKIKVFNATKDELLKDMMKAVEFDQSRLFKLIYEAEFGTYGGNPYSLLVGDYAIGSNGADMDFLGKIAEVAASAHAPFIAQASQELFGLTGFDKLDKPRDLKKIFEGAELIGWQAFRELEDARYVSLVLPRALLRLPYGAPTKRNTTACEGINFDESVTSAIPSARLLKDGDVASYAAPEADHFLWGNPAFMLTQRITNAFSLYSWTAAIRGVEGGGLVEGLPSYTYTSNSGATELFCPTETTITDRREKELNDLGFISLCHCKGSNKAAFFGGQTTNLPKKYFSDSANANAKISAMLPYMLAASRFAHYIKVIMRDKIGSFLTRGNIEQYLNSWISNYVLLDDNASQEVKASFPLREANVVVTEVPGEPGVYRATVFLKPHFQLEELTASIRLVANLPS